MNYNIIGEPFPAVVCTLNADESMITERGSMCWMSPNMKMETTSNGGIGKVFGRMFSGEAMFQNHAQQPAHRSRERLPCKRKHG